VCTRWQTPRASSCRSGSGRAKGLVFQRGDLRTVLSASVARNDSITPRQTQSRGAIRLKA
jgi:hypothetical protein